MHRTALRGSPPGLHQASQPSGAAIWGSIQHHSPPGQSYGASSSITVLRGLTLAARQPARMCSSAPSAPRPSVLLQRPANVAWQLSPARAFARPRHGTSSPPSAPRCTVQQHGRASFNTSPRRGTSRTRFLQHRLAAPAFHGTVFVQRLHAVARPRRRRLPARRSTILPARPARPGPPRPLRLPRMFMGGYLALRASSDHAMSNSTTSTLHRPPWGASVPPTRELRQDSPNAHARTHRVLLLSLLL